MGSNIRVYVHGQRRDQEGWFDVDSSMDKQDVIALGEERVFEEADDSGVITFVIQEVDGVDVDEEAGPEEIAELAKHDGHAVLAALIEYHNDVDQALILLRGGYVVWENREEIIDAELEDYSLPYFITHAIDEEKIWLSIKDGRTLVEVGGGTFVEFHK